MINIDRILEDLHIKKINNKSGRDLSTFKIGGELRNLIYIEDEKKLSSVLKEFHKNNVSYMILGNGSNVLFKDDMIEDVVIKLGENFSTINALNDTTFQIGASYLMPSLSTLFSKNSLSGFEFACNLPAQFGGALYMNASFKGQKISDVLENIRVCKENGEIEVINKDDLEIMIKKISIPKNSVIMGAKVKLLKSDREKIELKIKENKDFRLKTQPKVPSAGCIFKNPSIEHSAGMLIDKSGLKGISRGGAMISTLHANWIINPDLKATASDVKELMEIAKEKVYENFKEILEPEIVIM